MHFSKVKYTKEFQYHGISEWIGSEVSLEPGDDPNLALHEARKLAHEFYSEIVPKNGGEGKIIEKEIVSDSLKESLDAINNCETFEELQGYWLLSKSNLNLATAYKTKQKQFQNAGNK